MVNPSIVNHGNGNHNADRWTEMMAKMNEKPLIPIRSVIGLLAILSTGFAYAASANLNLIIDPIARDGINLTSSNQKFSQLNQSKPRMLEPKFDSDLPDYYYFWSLSDRFAIRTAYYYGYLPVNIISGRLCERFNVVRIMLGAHIISMLMTLLTPISIHGGVIVIFLVRFTQGISHGPILTGIYVLVTRWFPKKELGLVLSLIFASIAIGQAVTIPLSGYLCHPLSHRGSSWSSWSMSNDWPAVFYIIGGLNGTFLVFWWLMVTPDPSSHRWISEYELRLIQRESSSNQRRKIVKVNWYKLWSSKKIWSVFIAQGSWSIGYILVTSYLPIYLQFVWSFSNGTNQWIIFYLLMSIVVTLVISGPLSDWIIIKKIVHVSITRKIFETCSLLIPAICFIVITFLSHDTTSILIILTFSMLALGLRAGGDIPLISEMSPDLVGTVFGIANTASTASGLSVPIIVYAILGSKETDDFRWNMIFIVIGCIMILGWFYFIIFASSTPQPWGIAPNRSQSIATVVSIEMPEVSRFRLWFERRKQRMSQAALVFKY